MAFTYSTSVADPNAAKDTQDSIVKQALNDALTTWGQYLGTGGNLEVQLNISDLGKPNAGGLIELAEGAPTQETDTGVAPDGHVLAQSDAAAALRNGTHVAASDITITFNSELLSSLTSETAPYNLVTLFEHELAHGFAFDGTRTSSGVLNTLYESPFDSHTTASSAGDFFTGAAAEYVYGGPVPLTTGLGSGSNYYHVGAAGTASDPARLRADLLYPIAMPGQGITALDLAILEDSGIPLAAGGYALIDPNPTTTISSLASIPGATVTDPLISGMTQPGEVVTIRSGSTVLGSVTANGSGAWSFLPTGLADGTVTLTASLEGASSPVQATITLTVNSTAELQQAFLDILGHGTDAGTLASLRAGLLTGGSIAALRSTLATSVECSTDLYNIWLAVVGRPISPGELASNQALLVNGASLAGLRSALAGSGEAAAAVTAIFQAVVGRGLVAGEQQVEANALSAGASLAGLRTALANSAEAAARITGVFTDTLGRAPTASELPAAGQALANGATLAGMRGTLAASAESTAAVAGVFQAVVGRGLAAGEQKLAASLLAGGVTLAGLRASLATSAEAGGKVIALFIGVVGRAPTAAELPAVAQALANGASLTSLQGVLANSAEAAAAVNAIFQAVVGRGTSAAEQPVALNGLASGVTLASLRTLLSTSAEAAAKVTTMFNDTVGRAPLASELPAVERALAGTASLASLWLALGTSTEEAAAVTALFTAVLGRAPTTAELPAVQQAIGGGASLGSMRAVLNASAEEGSAVTATYQSVLGRAPAPSELQAAVASIAKGGALSDARTALVGSAEVASDVTAVFQSALGRPANLVEIAADRSELQSGVNLALVNTQLAQLTGGPAPQPTGGPSIAITPETITSGTLAGSGPSLVYGLFNNNALVAGTTETVSAFFPNNPGEAIITGFNPATDVLQIQSKQAASFAQVSIFQLDANDTTVSLPGGATFVLDGTPQAALTAANFRFV